MLLDPSAGCAGVATDGALAPICPDCTRIGCPTRNSIIPAARLVQGEWQCAERRSSGHVPDGAPDRQVGAPLEPSTLTGGAGCAGVQTGGAQWLSAW